MKKRMRRNTIDQGLQWNQFDSLPARLLCSAGVEGKEKSIGDGGGAGVSLYSWLDREKVLAALKAALTS